MRMCSQLLTELLWANNLLLMPDSCYMWKIHTLVSHHNKKKKKNIFVFLLMDTNLHVKNTVFINILFDALDFFVSFHLILADGLPSLMVQPSGGIFSSHRANMKD